MKRLIFLFLFSIFLLTAEELPKVCLNMIVKNETPVIRRCLESVKPLIDYWVIVDTGSTDGTQEMIQEYMRDIPGELHERPWVNFEENRNEALDLAYGKSEYLLFIDADDILQFSADYRLPPLDKECYYIKIDYGWTTYSRIQLIRNSLKWRWVGVVHEALVGPASNDAHLEGIIMKIIGGGDRSHDPKKYLRDAALLEKALESNPNDTRNTFYLAQSYKDAGMNEMAMKVYQRRAEQGGWDEEVFWSLYQIALIQESLEMPEEMVTHGYQRAYDYRPIRAEPLYHLSNYYRLRGNYLLGYLFAAYGLDLEVPKDVLFVEKWVYDFGLLLEYSISSYWIGRYDESIRACGELLCMPDLPQNVRECTQRNLQFALDKIQSNKKPSRHKKAI
jgi:glycosyltransferase involved in cell wall biosynthesis